jgi:hypothetical protein
MKYFIRNEFISIQIKKKRIYPINKNKTFVLFVSLFIFIYTHELITLFHVVLIGHAQVAPPHTMFPGQIQCPK